MYDWLRAILAETTRRLPPLAIRALTVLALSLLVLPARAQVAAYSVLNADFYDNGYFTPQTIGDVFTPKNNVTVTALGFLDINHSGLVEDHEVGIFDMAGTLLVSATVDAGTGDMLDGDFRYVDIPSILLLAGQQYTIAAQLTGNGDLVGYVSNTHTNLSINPDLDIPNNKANRYAFPSPTLTNPTLLGVTSDFYVGPNFKIGAAVVPEPASLGLLLTGLLVPGAAFLYRRKIGR